MTQPLITENYSVDLFEVTVRDYLSQNEFWLSPTDGSAIPVRNMARDHCHMALQWLERNSTGLMIVVENELNTLIQDGAEDVTVADILRLVGTSSRELIQDTNLYKTINHMYRSVRAGSHG